MKRYRVPVQKIEKTWYIGIEEVEAESKEAAIEKVEKKVRENEVEIDAWDYSDNDVLEYWVMDDPEQVECLDEEEGVEG